ncbi:MAG: glycosyltransferase [bacterium]
MKTIVLIPAVGSARRLNDCVRSVLAQKPSPTQVLVVLGEEALKLPEDPRIATLHAPAARRFAAACNAGFQACLEHGGDDAVVVVMDGHCEAEEIDWLQKLTAPLEKDAKTGVTGSFAQTTKGGFLYEGSQLVPPLFYGQNQDQFRAAAGRLFPEQPDYVAGFCLAVRLPVIRKAGLMDEAFGAGHFEFSDLWTRAEKSGWKTQFVPHLPFRYHENGALPAENFQTALRYECNRLRFVFKHVDGDSLEHQFWPAERRQIPQRIARGSARPLEEAYSRMLLALPDLAASDPRILRRAGVLKMRLEEMRSAITANEMPAPSRSAPPPAERRYHGSNDLSPLPVVTVKTSESARRPPFKTGERPPVSIVILTWNGLDYTKRCINSLREMTEGVDYHIIVVDNKSTDGTPEWLQTVEGVKLIRNETNEGYVRGNNRGLRAIPPDHDVVLLNNDIRIIQENWLERLRDAANEHPDYGVLGCKMLWPDGRLLHTGTVMPLNNYWGFQIGSNEENINQYPGINEVEGVVGACMYIRRDARQVVGLLDEDFFSYFEDTDYCLRAWKRGYKVVCVNDVSMIHYQGVSSTENKANWSDMFKTSQETFVGKWEEDLKGRFTRRLMWHSMITPPTGYAMSSREFILALDRVGVDVRYSFLLGADPSEGNSGDPRLEQLRSRPKSNKLPQVLYSQCDLFHKNAGSYKIGYSMLETTGIPKDWVEQANEMDEVWVPSHFNKQTFEASGVKRPIHVIPLGINTDYYHPGIRGYRTSPRYTFLSVFEWGERKAPEMLLRAFARAFTDKDDVMLLLKVLNVDTSRSIRREIDALELPANAPPIAILHNNIIKSYQMASLYRSADCFVLPTRGEGWGMPILEAMACGLPAIATNWSAQTEFMNETNAYPLNIKGLIPAVAKCASSGNLGA